MINISINPLTNFIDSTDAIKQQIIKDMRKVDGKRAFHYQTLKSVLPKYAKEGFSKEVLIEALDRLKGQEQDTDWKVRNVSNSILAIRTFISSEFPTYFSRIKCSFNKKVEVKAYIINGLLVRVSPDLIFRWEVDGKKYVGGLKFHIGKSKILPSSTGIMRAVLIYDFLRQEVAKEDEIVDFSYCFCYDVFYDNLYKSPTNSVFYLRKLKQACTEIKSLYMSA
ncbi:MAG: hypothetical protein PF481_08970 [Bacteroidales bacterium]|jgi:hypothetical protein|nr:hypothetical protein [Bacteroidales bacterium]